MGVGRMPTPRPAGTRAPQGAMRCCCLRVSGDCCKPARAGGTLATRTRPRWEPGAPPCPPGTRSSIAHGEAT